MKTVLVLLALLGAAFCEIDGSGEWYTSSAAPVTVIPTSAPTGLNKDRECACTLENLWLDVVAVIDNSQGMGSGGLIQVAADLASVFGQSTVGSGYNDPRSVRVGIVLYSDSASVAYDLNYFQDRDQMIEHIFDVLSQPSASSESNLKQGLSVAADLLAKNRTNGYRSNYKQAIIVYASDYSQNGNQDPTIVAGGIKGSGTSIITVAFNQGAGNLDGLSKVASPGFNFTSADLNLVGEVQDSLCQTNCFCQDGWEQYRAVYGDLTTFKYGVCLSAANLDSMWTAAKFACQNEYQGAYLVTEFDQQKHNFNLELFKNISTNTVPYAYHIGLSYTNGAYSWEQGQSRTKKPLSNQRYQGWNSGFPLSNPSSAPCVDNQQLGTASTVGWSNANCYSVSRKYLCESASCDTDKYCA